jgi:hypothetical protein
LFSILSTGAVSHRTLAFPGRLRAESILNDKTQGFEPKSTNPRSSPLIMQMIGCHLRAKKLPLT